MQFDENTLFYCWLLGLVGLPFIHRIYLKTWKEGRWFVLRIASFNFLFLGWVLDYFLLEKMNQLASVAEIEYIEEKKMKTIEHLETERGRICELVIFLSFFLSILDLTCCCSVVLYGRMEIEARDGSLVSPQASSPPHIPAVLGLSSESIEANKRGGKLVRGRGKLGSFR